MNAQYLRPRLARPLSAGAEGDLRRGVAGVAGGGFRADQAAARFHRHQLLHPQRHQGTTTSYPLKAGAGAAAAGHLHRDRLGGVPAGPDRPAAVGQGDATATCRSTSPRTARPSSIRRWPSDRRGACAIRCAWTTCASTSRAVHDAIEAGCDIRGYMRVVAAGQPGMVAGLLQALRHDPRELRDPGTHAEGQRAVVLRR